MKKSESKQGLNRARVTEREAGCWQLAPHRGHTRTRAPLFLLLAVVLCAAAAAEAGTRVALVSEPDNGEVANVLHLAAAKLSQDKETELVDRDSIRRVLQEQRLSLAGQIDPSNVVKAGRLLGVDLFAVVDMITQNNAANDVASELAVGLVVFDARTGVRLCDTALSAPGAEPLAALVADNVRLAQRKRLTAGLPTICLMSVRNADPPRGFDAFCDSVGLLLTRRLAASSNCAVLERQRLDQVNREAELPGALAQKQLAASVVMIELECGRGQTAHGLRATMRLANNRGRALATANVASEAADADELAAALYDKAAEILKLRPGEVRGDRRNESARFHREAGFCFSHGDREHGLADLEAAYALNPGGLRRELACALISCSAAKTNLLYNLRMADRGANLFLDCAREARSRVKPDSPRAAFTFTTQFHEWDAYMRGFNGNTLRDASYLSPAEMQEAHELLRSVYNKFGSFRRDIALPALFEAKLHHPDDSTLQGRDLFHDYGFVALAGLWSTEGLSGLFPQEWSADWLANVKGYLSLIAKLPLGRQSSEEIKFTLHALLLSPPTWHKVLLADRKQAWSLAAASPNPLVRAYGKLSQLNTAEGGEDRIRLAAEHAYRLYLQDCLLDPAQSATPTERRLIYDAATGYGVFKSLTGEQMVPFCDFMLGQDDVHAEVVEHAVAWLIAQADNQSARAAAALCDRALTVLKKGQARYFGKESVEQYAKELIKQRGLAQQKAKEGPELEAGESSPAWSQVRQLVDLAGASEGLGWIFRPVVQGEVVYAAGFGTEGEAGGQFLRLLRIPLDGGGVKKLGSMSVTGVRWEGGGCSWSTGWESPEVRVTRQLSFPRAACLDADNYYLGTAKGVFVFPRSGGQPKRIGAADGLPSEEVTALDWLDGKLYIGLGEAGYLVSYDSKKGRCDVLCSARRREHRSPFDNGSPLRISFLLADEARHRLLLLADQSGGGGDWARDLSRARRSKTDVFPVICKQARAGLFAYSPEKREFKALLPRHPNAPINDVIWAGRVSDAQLAFVCRGGSVGAALFDLATDKPTLLYGTCCALGLEEGMGRMVESRGMILNPALHSAPLMQQGAPDCRSAAFVSDGWIWTAGSGGNELGFCRVSINSTRKEELPPLRPTLPRFFPRECFRLIEPRRALIGDQCGLWLVQLAKDTTTADGAQGQIILEEAN